MPNDTNVICFTSFHDTFYTSDDTNIKHYIDVMVDMFNGSHDITSFHDALNMSADTNLMFFTPFHDT